MHNVVVFQLPGNQIDERRTFRGGETSTSAYSDPKNITEGGVLSFEKGMEIEYESAVNLAGTKDFSEGIKAFLEKRKPDWD
jgi:enoyl-CoA hydratase/carnithine racemase